jgi:hypothetical protein
MNTASDHYLYPGTDVLRTVPGLRNAERLAAFETAKTAQRIYEIQRTPVVGEFDTTHLKTIHPQVFQGVSRGQGNFARRCWEKQNPWGSHPPGLHRRTYWNTRRNECLTRCTARTCCAESSQSILRAKPPACSRRSMRYILFVKGMA